MAAGGITATGSTAEVRSAAAPRRPEAAAATGPRPRFDPVPAAAPSRRRDRPLPVGDEAGQGEGRPDAAARGVAADRGGAVSFAAFLAQSFAQEAEPGADPPPRPQLVAAAYRRHGGSAQRGSGLKGELLLPGQASAGGIDLTV